VSIQLVTPHRDPRTLHACRALEPDSEGKRTTTDPRTTHGDQSQDYEDLKTFSWTPLEAVELGFDSIAIVSGAN
jgi:hypothetical protein